MNVGIIETIKSRFEGNIKSIEAINGREVYIGAAREKAGELGSYLNGWPGSSLALLHAGDERSVNGCFGVYYTFAVRSEGILAIVKVQAEGDRPEVDSIAVSIPAAGLYEREIRDMFGIRFRGMPDTRELVFHGNWPEGLHPLRKEFDPSHKPEFTHRQQEFLRIEGEGVFEIPVGPVHAGIIEPGHFRFSVAGEPIINLEAKLYYVHKGTEKLAEGKPFEKVLYFSERISGDETVANSLAYCQAVESAAGFGALPERALYSRVILSELERILSHMGDLGGICTDVAYYFAAYQFTMMRRWCQVLNETLTGSRYLRSTITPGGIRKDYIKGREKYLLDEMSRLEKEFTETVDIVKSNSLFIDRVENTGIIPKAAAYDLNAVGPAGRSAGMDRDVRKYLPYAAYDKMDFRVPVHGNGDVNCRMNVKIEEILESISMIRQAVGKMPSQGECRENIHRLEPYKYAFGLTEAPRGENCHWIMTGEKGTIFRYRARTPSFCNWPVLCHAVKGNIVPDFPLINKSFNLSYSGNDL